VFDMQAAMLSQQLLERCSLVGGRIVQNHDHLAPQVAQQLAQKQANFFMPDIVESYIRLRRPPALRLASLLQSQYAVVAHWSLKSTPTVSRSRLGLSSDR
jgi:hypothetical protein